jgi:pyruvate kinase
MIMDRNTKIIATIGPASRDEDVIKKLIEAGIDVARLNFSHGSYDEHARVISTIRKISVEMGKPITILQDLQGPKLRVGVLPENGILLIIGQIVVLAAPKETQTLLQGFKDVTVIPFEIPDLTNNLRVGNRVLLDDGKLELRVTEITRDFIRAEVVIGGNLTSHKGVNLPGAPLAISNFTEKDKNDLIFGLDQGVDAIALSFIRSANDLKIVKDAIHQHSADHKTIPLIAKLERPEAIHNLDEILEEADGVMVARGDLAVETSPAEVPVMQKKIIHSANQKAKLVITATQMLESMIHNPRPTRAEASDIANAIFDGTDAVMLSGETAAGEYPVESVKMMDAIVCEAEAHLQEWGHSQNLKVEEYTDDAVSITYAARELAHDRNVLRIAVFTLSGRTALLMSKARPRVPIVAFTPRQDTYQRMGLFWGVRPLLSPYATSVEEMLLNMETGMINQVALQPEQQVVVICGFPVGKECPPNLALLHTIHKSQSCE